MAEVMGIRETSLQDWLKEVDSAELDVVDPFKFTVATDSELSSSEDNIVVELLISLLSLF